jgi:glycosyltransferase involved in cell wall biosynthesis
VPVGVVVVIPAYNAARHLAGVVARVRAAAVPDLARIVVVDDGSSDGTRDVVAALPRGRCDVQLVARARNGGYGAAMKDGLRQALALEPALERVACVHADGQYSPEALPALLAAARARGLDLLQGSRIASGTARSGGMPLYKIAANALLNRLENRTLGLAMTDYHSGYLVYGRRALALPLARLSNSFDFDLEVIASARAHGLAVAEAPVPTHYGDEVSHLNPFMYGLRVLRVMWNYRRGHYGPG